MKLVKNAELSRDYSTKLARWVASKEPYKALQGSWRQMIKAVIARSLAIPAMEP
jgi:hypothetical protein